MALSLTLSLVSHTNVGKTTLARTLLARDIGEVRDAAHVTDLAEGHVLMKSHSGDLLQLWDTPGFGDSARLVRRMRLQGHPLGWLLSELWDRWRDRAFWSSQQALLHVRARADLVLYLVNAAEPDAGYLEPELQLLQWLGKPVLVLLNQLGAPREPAVEAAELSVWRERMKLHGVVRDVLPLDAFARCWVQEAALWHAVRRALPREQAAAMQRLTLAWTKEREAVFDAAMHALAQSLAHIATTRQPLPGAAAMADRLRDGVRRVVNAVKSDVGGQASEHANDPASRAARELALAAQQEVRTGTQRLLELHGQRGHAADPILERVARQVAVHAKLDESKAALWGGVVSGALLGLKADIASGGLTLGGGLLAGGLLGALGAAGVARGVNVMRGAGRGWVGWKPEALTPMVHAALLRYLAVAHFGRGRGDWQEGEAPPFWHGVVSEALAPHEAALTSLWQQRGESVGAAEEAPRLAAALTPLLAASSRRAMQLLYPLAAPS